jgi:hypothetical protein
MSREIAVLFTVSPVLSELINMSVFGLCNTHVFKSTLCGAHEAICKLCHQGLYIAATLQHSGILA